MPGEIAVRVRVVVRSVPRGTACAPAFSLRPYPRSALALRDGPMRGRPRPTGGAPAIQGSRSRTAPSPEALASSPHHSSSAGSWSTAGPSAAPRPLPPFASSPPSPPRQNQKPKKEQERQIKLPALSFARRRKAQGAIMFGGFGATTPSTSFGAAPTGFPSFGGGSTASTSGAGLFGGAASTPPAFGAAASAPSLAFGALGTTQFGASTPSTGGEPGASRSNLSLAPQQLFSPSLDACCIGS